jgi:hypothetical protein
VEYFIDYEIADNNVLVEPGSTAECLYWGAPPPEDETKRIEGADSNKMGDDNAPHEEHSAGRTVDE